ncbi:atypical chemokine receptor 3 [Spea bombifrons]|uniref:atypical chemokine receptor 3 n=1 Tax=Spea bombifrons TaxID=233779 RepID=UPI00234BB3B3|nr:atypical chemokine receptor 3 [Spea bombifrons]XP_053327440.1 atypical chemokine receptor 3 [Spea bombifrons]
MSTFELAAAMDYLESTNSSDFNLNCTNGDCIILESLSCPGTVNKSALLYTLAIVYIFIFVMGLLANSVVIWLNLQAKSTGYETHLYIFNLAVADLCVLLTLPVWVVSLVQHKQWPMGEMTCKITHLIFSINLYSSIFFLMCMSVDRYLSVSLRGTAGQYRRKIIRRLVCALVWLVAFAVSLPDTYYLKTVSSPITNETYCRAMYPEDTFNEWLLGMELLSIMVGFIIPFPVIAVFYCLLAWTLSSSSSASDQERRISGRVIVSYVVVFIVCWLPYHMTVMLDVLTFLQLIPFSCQLDNFLYAALHITQCYSLLHCCINPILYSFIHRNYRYEIMKAFIFRYSSKTGLTKLIDSSKVSEAEYSAVEQNPK